MTSTARLARNTVILSLGQVVPAVAGVLAVPVLLAHLGPARFGVLLLAWGAIGYFSLFDLGLSRALTHAVAVRLGQREADDLSAVTWTALALMALLGVAGGVLLAVLTPWLVGHVLNIEAALQHESRVAFYLLAAALPAVVSTAGFRGILEAHQDFGTATALRLPLAIFTSLGPLAALPFSSRLPPVVACLLAVRLLTWAAHAWVCVRRYPFLRRVQLRRRVIAPMLRFGGWMTVSNVVSPVMAYLDRFFIGAILPMAAVAFYVAPSEIVTRLLAVPQALMGVLFPAIATTYQSDRPRTTVLFDRAVRIVLLLMFPVLAGVVLFAREGLTLWLGAPFAAQATGVLQWLAAGVFLNSIAQVPFALIQGVGRPDVTGKLHLAELPIYVASIWVLAHRFGLVGVAIAWTGRVGIDAALLLWFAHRTASGRAPRPGRAAALTLAMLAVMAMLPTLRSLPAKVAAYGVLLAGTAATGWFAALRAPERDVLRAWARLRRPLPD